jgi:hypothetical protein
MSSDAFGYSPALPEDIREIFMWLCQDVASLQIKWNTYLELFSDQETTDLLSALAQGFFQAIEESLRDDMTMAICRLSDRPRSKGKHNLSIPTLVQRCRHIERVSDLFKDFVVACEPVRQYRNKRVGHNDLNTTIKPHDNPLPGIGRRQIDTILRLASQILNLVYRHYVGDAELHFKPVQVGDAGALIFWLKMAHEYETAKRNAALGKAG